MKKHHNLVAALALLSTLSPQLSTVFAQGTSAFAYQGQLNDGGGVANIKARGL